MNGKGTMTFLDAAERVLTEADEPLHSDAITASALEASLIKTKGSTPAATMNALLAVAIKKKGESSRFVRTAPGIFGLRSWVDSGRVKVNLGSGLHGVRVPHFPIYAEVAAVLPVWAGHTKGDVTGLRRAVQQLTGSPQNPLDWTNPDAWIPERLKQPEQGLAAAMWAVGVNPRYMTGHWLLASHYGLLIEHEDGKLTVTPEGHSFIKEPESDVVRNLDEAEGLAKLLAIVASVGPASSATFREPWSEYLERVSRIRSDSYLRAALWQRLRNLQARALVERAGNTYSVTAAGLDWLKAVGIQHDATGSKEEQGIWELARAQKEQVRDGLKALLAEMDPYAFERLIRDLLEVMGYDDAAVTSPSNDKGVDVVASIQVGITSVKEVVQVKRHKNNIQRPVLDALRGSLHRFQAMRGTIITTGGFSKGTVRAAFEPGAAPITLINGDKLADLLMEHGIGVRRKEVVVWELDPAAFDDDETEAADEAT